MLGGQSLTHRPHRTQAPKKALSDPAPGGRRAWAGKALAWLTASPNPNPSMLTPHPMRAALSTNARRSAWVTSLESFIQVLRAAFGLALCVRRVHAGTRQTFTTFAMHFSNYCNCSNFGYIFPEHMQSSAANYFAINFSNNKLLNALK
jgi:hypothetical protein